MKIEAKELVSKGYLFPELPPCFTTNQFGGVYQSLFTSASLNKIAKGKLTECVYFSVPKAGFNRRIMGIPNPLHYSILAESLENESARIVKAFKSDISCTTPERDTGRKAFKTRQNFASFVRHRFLISEEASFELKVDISRYYSTIYTHIIPWALHGRDKAKKDRSNALFGNILDRNMRNLQSGQTMGIPIGPDASLLVSEIIGSSLDREVRKKFPNIRAARYIDDYYFYFSNKIEAEKVLKFFQSLLSNYLLSPNEEKTGLREFPFSTDPIWIISLRSLKATCFNDDSGNEQEGDIRQFFSAAFDWAEKFPKDEIMKFAARTLYGVKISDKNWDYFQTWLIKMGLYDPYTLYEICAILYTNRERVSKETISLFVKELLDRHLSKRHSFEVAWTLWLAKILEINISDEQSEAIFDSNDVIPTLIGLDLREKGLISKRVKTLKLKLDLSNEGLSDGRWLLAYESYVKGWLKPLSSNKDFVNNHDFFSVLALNKISFYNANAVQDEVPDLSDKPESEKHKIVKYWLNVGGDYL